MIKKSFSSKKLNPKDTLWVLSLFGTAVGAGILFMPINAGLSGFWLLVLMTALVWKMTYFAHRGLARFVLSSRKGNGGITEVVEEHFGEGVGKFLTLLYFLSIYPIVLIYGVGVTNTVDHFLREQLGITPPPRALLSFVLVFSMMFVMWKGEKLMLKVTEYLVYPLAAFLVFISFYLIPYWNLSLVSEVPCFGSCLKTLWVSIPVLIFSFNHSPIISSFVQAQVRDYGRSEAEEKVSRILRRTATMLLGFVMFFVFSCVLSLSPSDLAEAKDLNISILSYFSRKFDSPIFSYLAPPIALLAIFSSFFGHYMGAREGFVALVVGDRKKARGRRLFVTLFFFLSIWGAALFNPSILGMIEVFSGPVIAMILFLLPMYAVRYVPSMAKYKGEWTNTFVVIVGLLALSSMVYSLFSFF